jgi:hypothetical protein
MGICRFWGKCPDSVCPSAISRARQQIAPFFLAPAPVATRLGELDAVFASSQHRAMVAPRLGIILAAACCALACGDRPEPPGPAVSNGEGPSLQPPSGAGSASGSLDRPGDDEAEPAEMTPADAPAASNADAGLAPAAPAGDDGDDESPPLAAGQTATACTDDGGGCLIVNIAVSDADENSCIQLALDNCESSAQAGLRVDLPVSWRLGSASISTSLEDCVPGAQFNPRNTSTVITASGSIEWNLATRAPSQVVLDVTLEPAGTALDPIRVTNSDLVDPLIECD